MSLGDCMSGKDAPYKQFVALPDKAAKYIEKVIELTPELPSETVAAIRKGTADLRH